MKHISFLKSIFLSGIVILAALTILPFATHSFGEQQLSIASDESFGKVRSFSDYGFSGLRENISLDVENMNVVDLLRFLAIRGKLNIVTGQGIAGAVTLLLEDVTIGDVLDIVLASTGLAYEVKNDIIRIITEAEYISLYGRKFYDNRAIEIVHLKYAPIGKVGAILANLKSDIGRIVFDEATRTIILMDTPEDVDQMKKVIQKLEVPTETKVFKLQYTKAEDIQEKLTKVLSIVGEIEIDVRTNRVIVTDIPAKIEKITKIIETFDFKTLEVFIEAKIVEVTLSDTFKWGIDWDAVIDITNKAGIFTLTPEFTFPVSLTGTFSKMTVNTIQGQDFNVVLEALSTISETRILSNPHLTVLSGTEAKIEVIERQPYEEETTTTASGGTSTTSKSYQWVDVGVLLNVTPEINEDGYITILIKPEVSSISTWYGGVAQAAGAVPVVKSATAETRVSIKDGTTIIIAGLIKDNKTKTINKLPILGDIPFLGKVFQSVSDDVRKTETIVFLTPRIVTGDRQFPLERNMKKEMFDVRE